ncbi:MAG TPA: hypothetical protein VF188_16645 [Longimicrobiales bacterium]
MRTLIQNCILFCASTAVATGCAADTSSSGADVTLTGGDAVESVCTVSEPLEPYGSIPVHSRVHQIITAGTELLLSTDAGLLRWSRSHWDTVATGGHAYVLRDDTLFRIIDGKLQLLHYTPGQPPMPVRALGLMGNESSLAIVNDIAFLHAPTNQNNFLITGRHLTDGTISGYMMPVERDFQELFLHDFEQLLDAASRLRSSGRWLLLLPYTHNPARLVDLDSAKQYAIYTARELRGRVVRGEIQVLENERTQECPTCTVHVTVRERRAPRIEAIHADAVFAENALWILGHVAPGSTAALLYRYPILNGRPAPGSAWRLSGLETRPRSLWIRPDTLLVAAEDALYRFPHPATGGAGECGRLR